MARTSSFSRAFRHIKADPKVRKKLKKFRSRLARRLGRRFLDDAPIPRLNDRDVV